MGTHSSSKLELNHVSSGCLDVVRAEHELLSSAVGYSNNVDVDCFARCCTSRGGSCHVLLGSGTTKEKSGGDCAEEMHLGLRTGLATSAEKVPGKE